jgi:hypothetical protein
MHKAYKDYYWKNGKPQGQNLADPEASTAFRVFVDPYFKRYTVEELFEGHFHRLIYDSALFDFRHLKRPENDKWRREPLSENEWLLRDEIDRPILKEIYTFEKDLCRQTQILTPQDHPVALQKITYTHLGDPFNGVTLFDLAGKAVLRKTYTWEPSSRTFTTLLEECWSDLNVDAASNKGIGVNP